MGVQPVPILQQSLQLLEGNIFTTFEHSLSECLSSQHSTNHLPQFEIIVLSAVATEHQQITTITDDVISDITWNNWSKWNTFTKWCQWLCFTITRAVLDFGSGSGRNPALFPNPAEIRIRQKSHQSRIVLPDLKSQFLECWMLDYLDLSCLRSTYCLHCCGINYCVSACKWCNGNCCTKNYQKLKSLVHS